MSGDLLLLRILAVSATPADRELLRRAAGAIAAPVDFLEADGGNSAAGMLAGGEIDIVFLDAAIPVADRTAIVTAARAAKSQPFVILVQASANGAADEDHNAQADGVAAKPSNMAAAMALLERFARVGLPSRVLVVDDSATMRSIVRKILSASRFRLDIAEAHEGAEALKQIGSGRFDLVVLDYNMPGLNGVETLAEIKHQHPRLGVVMMSSTPDLAVADRARAAGAAAFLKKPFYPSDIDAVLYAIFGLRMPAR
jgi:CheY-like chemotaxis protein